MRLINKKWFCIVFLTSAFCNVLIFGVEVAVSNDWLSDGVGEIVTGIFCVVNLPTLAIWSNLFNPNLGVGLCLMLLSCVFWAALVGFLFRRRINVL